MTHLPALEVLIERCEAAQAGSRELDELIYILATRVLANDHPDAVIDYCVAIRDDGWPWVPSASEPDPGSWHHMSFAPAFTASIDAALALAERLIPGCEVGIDPRFFIEDVEPNHVKFDVILCIPHWDRWNPVDGTWIERHEARHRNRVLAVLLATLKALRSLTKLEG
jgi:hypothetical protein